MGLKIVKLGVLLSLLTGCSPKPEPPPTKPGVSAQVHYPVVLVSQQRVVVKDDEESLTTTTVASGLNFPEFALLDSSGAKFSIGKVTDFDRKSTILDMGTTPYRVYLPLKNEGTLVLADAKKLVTGGKNVPAIANTTSMQELIDACRRSWEWK
jgi:hypothetical protein